MQFTAKTVEEAKQEALKTLGITEEQVKVTLFRARQRIRQAFEKIENYGL